MRFLFKINSVRMPAARQWRSPPFFKRKKWWGLPVLVHWTTDSCVLCCSPLRCRGRALTGQVCTHTHTHTWRYRKSHAFACYAGHTDLPLAQSCVLYKLINTLLNLPPLYTHNYWHRGTNRRQKSTGWRELYINYVRKSLMCLFHIYMWKFPIIYYMSPKNTFLW